MNRWINYDYETENELSMNKVLERAAARHQEELAMKGLPNVVHEYLDTIRKERPDSPVLPENQK